MLEYFRSYRASFIFSTWFICVPGMFCVTHARAEAKHRPGGGGLITSAKAARHEVGLPKVRHSGAVRETPCSQCPGKRSLGTWAIPGNRQRNIITMGATARVAFVVTWTEESVPGCGGCRPWGVPCQTCNHHRTFLVSSTNREEAVKIQCPWKGSIKDD